MCTGQGLKITFVCGLGDLGASLDICHSFPKSQPFGFGGFAGFLFSVDLEIGRIVDGGFNPEDAPLFIVEFDGVTLESVFDPYSLRTVFEIGNEFSGEARGYTPGRGYVFPEKPHDIRAGEGRHPVVHQGSVM